MQEVGRGCVTLSWLKRRHRAPNARELDLIVVMMEDEMGAWLCGCRSLQNIGDHGIFASYCDAS